MSSLSIDQILQICSILASGAYVGWQIKGAKKLEIDSKIHEQRKVQYNELISLFKKMFIAIKNPEKDIGTTEVFSQEEWININFNMSIYASENVFKAYLKMMKTAKENPMMAVKSLGDLILIMRKEVGYDDSTLTSRQVLSTFINDIDSPDNDKFFK
jgi:hypothetical protein